MPVVTVDPGDYDRFPLTSAPADPNDPNDEDGYIMARPLPYGMKLKRRDRSSKMTMRGDKKDASLELGSFIEGNVKFDFGYCIGEHNLKDKNGNLVDFTQPTAFALLDPRVGDEIESILNKINGDEDEEDASDFQRQSSSSSQEGQ
jgi:hypothetical protein